MCHVIVVTLGVVAASHQPKVIWINTNLITTNMVDSQIAGNQPHKLLVRKAMRANKRLLVAIKIAITGIHQGPGPQPAAAIGLRDIITLKPLQIRHNA